MAARRVFRRSSVRRSTFWEGTSFTVSVASGGKSVVTVIAENLLENTPNATLVRVRGNVTGHLTAQGAAATATALAYGLMVVNQPALTAGVASLPGPLQELWRAQGLQTTIAIGGAEAILGMRAFDHEVDSKAMRKTGLNQAIVFIAENGALISTGVIQITVNLRLLFKR